jgi:ATP-dependent Clp protease ATP-binding subunit ClpA
MDATCILEPLPSDMSKQEISTHKHNYAKVQDILKEVKKEETMSFTEFLDKCGLDKQQYLLALRSSLDKTKVFLKREIADIRTNNYNPNLLQIWKANTDIQFVLDPWAVCAYIASYMMKAQRGMGLLLQEACREA